MSCSTRLRSLSVSFTRDTFSVLFADAFACAAMDSVEGTEKVRDLMFDICKFGTLVNNGVKDQRMQKFKDNTFWAKAVGASAVPNNSLAFFLSASFTF